jgi:hypothetical protein
VMSQGQSQSTNFGVGETVLRKVKRSSYYA